MIVVPVILAGGIGERFWPASKSTYPKQLLKLTGDQSILELTLDRVYPLCKKDVKPLLITGKDIISALKKVIPQEKAFDVIVEPVGKNTAPAIGLAAAWIKKKYGDAVMVVVSADHAIVPVGAYLKAVRAAVREAAANNALVVFGITPERPDTGYGYINVTSPATVCKGVTSYSVKKFVEKPTLQKARTYVKRGTYLWNSGMFVWKTSVILDEFELSLPEMFQEIIRAEKKAFSRKAIELFYSLVDSISIDYGIMEDAVNVRAIVGTFRWDDVGSWDAIRRLRTSDEQGNVLSGERLVQYNCKNTMVFNQTDISVAAVGLDNISVIAADGVVLVIDRKHLPEIKKALGSIKKSAILPKKLF